ncbi:TPA: poly-alpha-2,8 sialosyl sialyltransferase, partial [Escherichia coli]|nr:poly-alpha-2,8 sialosyl sialyltransferase [Escherichia coli]HCP3323063.1 poly-alpha-2,8 sialosyl sialyltransferase [Escherichia coli]
MIFDASLKKLRKLFVNPIGFFRDSWFFNSKNKAEELLSPLKIKSKNIFIISNLGQLKKAESFVQKFSKRSNYLIVLATEKNTEMPKIIVEQINNKLFSSYKVLFIPTFPNVFSLKKVIWFYNVYNYLV